MDGLQIHGGSNITVSNNIFNLGSSGHAAVLFQSTYATSIGTPLPMTNNVFKNNVITSSESNPVAFSNMSGGTPTISNNFYTDLINSHFQTNGLSQSGAVYGNAMFANQAAGNYTLGTTSGAHKIGFVSINQSVMGPHPKTAHWYGTFS
jgi:hypothetical protein